VAEEELLAQKYVEYGPAWRTLAAFFPCHTDIDIKNCWQRRQRWIRRQGVNHAKNADGSFSGNTDVDGSDVWVWEAADF
jgi:hypothetical protein